MKGSHKQGRKRRPTAGVPVHMAGIFSAARATRPRHPHCPDPVSSRQHGWREFVIRSLRYSSNSIVTLVKWVKCRFMGGERVNLVLPPASCEPGLIFLADSTSISSVVVIYGWSTSAGPLFFKARCSKHHSPDYSSIYASVITTPLKFCSQLLVLVLKTWTKPNSTSRILKTEKLCKNKLQKSDADFFYKIRKEGRWKKTKW